MNWSEIPKRRGIVKATAYTAREHRNGGPRSLGENARKVTFGFHAPQRHRPAKVQHPKRAA